MKLWYNFLKVLFNLLCFHFDCRYGFGWRGGKWYANRQFRKEQMKLLGQIKPKRLQLLGPINSRGWQLKFLKRPSTKSKEPDTTSKASERAGDSPTTLNSGATKQSC